MLHRGLDVNLTEDTRCGSAADADLGLSGLRLLCEEPASLCTTRRREDTCRESAK